MKIKKWLIGGIASIVVIAAVVVALLFLGGGEKLAFSKDMITETIVNEVCDISDYVENPEEKIIKLTATYQDEMGNEQQYLVAGLSFKPIKVGEVRLKVEATDGESIETTIDVIEAAPQVVTTNDAIYYLRQTIKLQDLLQHVEYNSNSEPEFIVHSLEFGAENIDLSNEEEYTFEEVGNYAFQVELKNYGGSAEAIITVKVVPELTDKEKDDLTNNSILGIGSHATLTLCEDDHADNSDWCWEITANPGDVWVAEGDVNYYSNVVWVDFGQEVDLSQYYFTMDIKASEDSAGIAIHYLSAAQRMSSIPMGFQNILGRWTHISSQDKYDEGLYTGIYIVLVHKKEGDYDPTNVKVKIDNLHLHPYQDPNAPIIVGGTEDYEITSGKVTWSSKLEDTGFQANYVQFNKEYTNQTFTFTTTIQDAKKPNLIIGARMDGAKTAFDKNEGVVLRFHDKFFEIFAPKYGQKWLGAENVSFESGKKYTFAYSVETLGGQDIFFLKIIDAAGKTILDYSLELPKGINKSGDFVIWSMNPEMTIEYKEPVTIKRKANKNVVVGKDGKDGVAGISTATPGHISKSSYLAMDGEYTNETFSFTTKIQDAKNPYLVIGARMAGNDVNPDKFAGLTLQLYNGFFEVYAPKYGTWIAAENLTLRSGKTYTFDISVTTEKAVSTLYFVVRQGNEILLNYVLKDIKTTLPKAGDFMVWSANESTDITYKMPVYVKQPTNKNVVIAKDGVAGTANLKTVMPNDVAVSSYLAMWGNYTNELFEFTTVISDLNAPNLIIGAHMSDIVENPDKAEGVSIAIYGNFYEVYAPKYGTWITAANYNEAQTSLSAGVAYTFGVQILDGNLFLTVKNGESIVHTNTIALPNTVPEKGNFMVWNQDETRSIDYKMPIYEEPKTNVNVEVESTGEAGNAELETVTPNDVAKGSYLAMKGAYTNEIFEFTTTIADGANPNLVIGARMADVVMNPDKADGVTVRFYNGFLEVYAPKYGTWVAAKSITLESGKAYTFTVQTDGNTLYLDVKQGGTVVLEYTKELEATIPTSGNFMVWSLDAERSIDYTMPVAPIVEPETNTNVEVESTGVAGTAELKTVIANDVAKGSYLAMKGDYTNETFTFMTTIADGANPNLVIGAHMTDVTTNPDKANGVTIRFYGGFLEVYAPKYGTWVAAQSVTLENGKAYTFSVQLDDNHLKLVVKAGETVVLDYAKEIEVAIPEVLPTSGNFMVWNLDAERTIDYTMPIAPVVEPETNTNVEVESTGEAGTAQLETVTPNDVAHGSYLAMKGAYTNETFEFTTTIADGATPNLVIGARMADIVMNPDKADGVTVRFYNGFLEVYAPKYGTWVAAKSVTLESGKTYAFSVQLDGNVLKLIVKQGETVVLDYAKELEATIPASGNFMVWNLDAQRSIDYKMPVAPFVEPETNINVEVESTGNAGTAELVTVTPNDVAKGSYLAMKGAYTDEVFEFNTTIADGANPNLLIGARMADVVMNPDKADGVTVRFYNGFLEVYAPKYGTWVAAKSVTLESGKSYTFRVQMVGNTLKLVVKQGETTVLDYTKEIEATIPASGNFIVWNLDAKRSITYTMPASHAEVLSGEALVANANKGTATMALPENVGLWNQSYLVTKNSFSAEHFRFTTTITDGANPNLVFGARVQGEAPSYGSYDGLVYRLYDGFYEIYYIKDKQSILLGAKSLALTSGAEYTFDLYVTTVGDTTSTKLIVKQGETEVHNKVVTTTEAIPTTGRFAIWSQEARTVKYEIEQ